FVNAGHNAPIVVHPDGMIEELEGTSVILGAFDFAIYQEQVFQMRPGDLICLYTDGVTEAKDRSGNLLGEERLHQILASSHKDSPQKIVEEIFSVVSEHSSGIPQSDDVSVFVVRYKVTEAIEDTVH
ncbi:MAG TPA: PP2C family protein-serine/threonine phosphatase, partial [Candidatus Hodarchaeales archaeon]|nr:PP2C family protein-serine/threonine phosphatase [Candidatus Hodarchaeales archaeon]